MRNYLYILVAFVVVYAVRVLPLTLIRKPIQSRFVRSFLRYVPFVTLAVMTFPAIMQDTMTPAAGIAALVVGIAVALWKGNLVAVAGACCVVVFAVEAFLA